MMKKYKYTWVFLSFLYWNGEGNWNHSSWKTRTVFSFIQLILWTLMANSLKNIPVGTIDNKSAFVQVLAWHWTGAKSLPRPMLNQFTDTISHHQSPVDLICFTLGLYFLNTHHTSLRQTYNLKTHTAPNSPTPISHNIRHDYKIYPVLMVPLNVLRNLLPYTVNCLTPLA